MPKTTPTRLQRYHDYFANHRFLSVVVIIGITIIAVASFTDSFSKLLDLAKRPFVSDSAEMVVTLHVQNSGSQTVQIEPVCDFEVVEAIRNSSTTYFGLGDRLRLSPPSSVSGPDAYRLQPKTERDYRVRLPRNQLSRDLSDRGAATIKFVVWLSDGRSANGSIEFQEDAFRRKRATVAF